MEKLQRIVNRLKQLTPERMQEIALAAVRANEQAVADMNRAQLFEGLQSTGELIEPQYQSDSYARYKFTLNPLGVVDLKVTGAFYSGIFVSADKFPIYLFSRDEKTRKLVGKYGFDIFGLSKENLAALAADMVEPDLQAAILKAAQL